MECDLQAYKHEGVGIGILGTGWGVRVQVPRFREAGLRILALYSRDKERGNSIAEKVGQAFPQAKYIHHSAPLAAQEFESPQIPHF